MNLEQYTAGQIIKETLEYEREFIKSHYKYIKNITYGFIPKEESAQYVIDEITINIIFEQIGKRIMEWVELFGGYYESLDQELEDSRRFLE